MSRGAWVLLIGIVLLVGGIVLAAFSILGFMGGFVPSVDTLGPGQYLNSTVELEVGDVLTYVVSIEGYSEGDQLEVFLLLPGGDQTGLAVVTSADLTRTYETTRAGDHVVVIRNTGTEEVSVLHFASSIAVSVAVWISIGGLLAIVGFIVVIVGIVFLVIDRKKTRPYP